MTTELNNCPVAVSVTQAATYLGIGRTKVYQLIHRGELKTLKIDRRTLVSMASIHALVNQAA